MNSSSKIYIAGHNGLVGSAIKRKLQEKGYDNIIGKTHSELNLLNYSSVLEFFKNERPEYVFLAAAKVGGIIANTTYRAQFIFENLQIQNNVVHAAYLHGVKKLLFLGSSCIYPKESPQPIREEYLLTSLLEYTNEPYAIAKIAGIKLCESYNIQYGTNFISVMPTNLYGFGDNYDLEKSHVLPALIRKLHLGKCLMNNDWNAIRADLDKRPISGIKGGSDEDILDVLNRFGIKRSTGNDQQITITLWGTGRPMREFMHSDDMADACIFLMNKVDFKDLVSDNEVRNTHINIGTGKDISIFELANIVRNVVGFNGCIEWDSSKPDGTYRKLLDVSRLNSLGWKYSIDLINGIQSVYKNYISKSDSKC
ncbi:MAG: GDP-L-fucose synthase family protein [Bacteroidales bacterium]